MQGNGNGFLPVPHISFDDTHRTIKPKTHLPLETETLEEYDFTESHILELEGNLEVS